MTTLVELGGITKALSDAQRRHIQYMSGSGRKRLDVFGWPPAGPKAVAKPKPPDEIDEMDRRIRDAQKRHIKFMGGV